MADGPEPIAAFWRQLHVRFPASCFVQACLGDALIAIGERTQGDQLLLGAFEQEPQLIYEFGDELVSGHADIAPQDHLRYQLCCLRAAIVDARESAHSEPNHSNDGSWTDEQCRELYLELLDEYREDAAAVVQIRELGHEIDALTVAERLPRTFVRRGSKRFDA